VLGEQYEKGKVFFKSKWIDISNVKEIEIRETPQLSNSYYPNLTSSTIFFGTRTDIKNATRRFIKSPPKGQSVEIEKTPKQLSKDIFIVHGRDHEPMKELKALLIELGFNPTVLHEQASGGSLTLVEKLEKYARGVGYAFVILTPEDVGGHRDEVRKNLVEGAHLLRQSLATFGNEVDGILAKFEPRARQNAIFEMGYFFALLGRENVCCLLKGKMEKPTDIDGVEYGHFDASIDEVKGKIIKELREAGYEIK
jgi:predicted nucleotide-binding protein